MNTLITLKQDINCRTKLFQKNVPPQSIFIYFYKLLNGFKTRKTAISTHNKIKMVSVPKIKNKMSCHPQKTDTIVWGNLNWAFMTLQLRPEISNTCFHSLNDLKLKILHFWSILGTFGPVNPTTRILSKYLTNFQRCCSNFKQKVRKIPRINML